MNTTHRCGLALVLACALPLSMAAEPPATDAPAMTAEQKAMMDAWTKAGTPGAEHARLGEQLAGTWNATMTMWMDPAAPPMTETGTSTNSMVLDGRHVHMAFKGQFMGRPFTGFGTTGYDNTLRRYTSTWVDNMSTAVMIALGDYDAATGTYTFRSEMADPAAGGKPIPIRETLQVIDADNHVMEMFETRDGAEARTMRIEYRRAK